MANLEDLSGTINTEKYLAPTSDIVALLVLEHQCRMHNLLTKAKLTPALAGNAKSLRPVDSKEYSPKPNALSSPSSMPIP